MLSAVFPCSKMYLDIYVYTVVEDVCIIKYAAQSVFSSMNAI